MTDIKFDLDVFYVELDIVRARRRLKWNEVAVAANVGESSLTRLKQGHPISIHAVASLARWANISMNHYLENGVSKLA